MISFSEHQLKLRDSGGSRVFSGLFEDTKLLASGFESGQSLAAKFALDGVVKSQNAALTSAVESFEAGDASGFSKLAKNVIQDGTDLQVEAWKVLSELEFGEVITYTELANRVARPKAVRSLASACKKNNHILIIGCHRVVKKNGLIGKYAYGPELKTELLDFESSLAD